MRRILLATLAGLGLAASVQAIAGPPNTIYDCELAALPKDPGSAVCAPYDPVESMKNTDVAPGNGPVTPTISDALTRIQMLPQPGPSSITVGLGKWLGTTPQMSVRVGDQVPTLIEVNSNTEGNVTECNVVKGSGSDYLDTTACDFVKVQWPSLKRLLPRPR